MEYDVVIPAAIKDYHKLRFCVESLKYLNPLPKLISIVTPTKIDVEELNKVSPCKVINELESDVMPLNPLEAKNFRRPRWIYQQFIKLFYSINKPDIYRYLVVDSDLILLRKLDLLTNNKFNFFLGIDQNHKPYFNMMEECFGFGRVYHHSFISEIMLMTTSISHSILIEMYYNCIRKNNNIPIKVILSIPPNILIEDVYKYVCKRCCEDWIPADYEIYGNFVEKYEPEKYNKVKFRTRLSGKHGNGLPPFPWTDVEIAKEIDICDKLDFDALTVHTWL